MTIMEKGHQNRKKALKFNTKKGKKFSDFTEEDVTNIEQDAENSKKEEENNENNGCAQ